MSVCDGPVHCGEGQFHVLAFVAEANPLVSHKNTTGQLRPGFLSLFRRLCLAETMRNQENADVGPGPGHDRVKSKPQAATRKRTTTQSYGAAAVPRRTPATES